MLSYLFFQFIQICKAQDLELKNLKSSLRDKSCLAYLQKVIKMQRNAKMLYKKVCMNILSKQIFEKVIIEEMQLLDQDVCSKYNYLTDLLFVNILD